ncbi:jg24670 [Pararge aegeria aegeria]|uniref:Jg24670 protein n=1 Tax=Pararge aegeria aegeria TaxID=348720 RepID=A0A8S4QWJ5_9NEOP|nr:jg24670 [Pararge aegeria aegeria]
MSGRVHVVKIVSRFRSHHYQSPGWALAWSSIFLHLRRSEAASFQLRTPRTLISLSTPSLHRPLGRPRPLRPSKVPSAKDDISLSTVTREPSYTKSLTVAKVFVLVQVNPPSVSKMLLLLPRILLIKDAALFLITQLMTDRKNKSFTCTHQ